MERILVTGGAGYIGSHVCQRLLLDGHKVGIVDNLSTGSRIALDALGHCEFYNSDILDFGAMSRILKDFQPGVVVHFAAAAYVGESMSDPLKYFDNNVAGTISLLKAMVSCLSEPKVIFSSSCSVYGSTNSAKGFSECSPLSPESNYARTKLNCEEILRSLVEAKKLTAVCLRLFNVGGASYDLRFGERHEPETHLIPLAILAALLPDRRLLIFGDDWDTPDGSCQRDYVHVEDVADAVSAAVHKLSYRASEFLGRFVPLNLGRGEPTSVFDLVATIETISSRVVKRSTVLRRAGDVARVYGDIGKANLLLGWTPKRTTFDICSSAYAFEFNRIRDIA